LVDRGADNAHVVTCSAPTFSTLTVNTSSSYTYAGKLSGNLDIAKTGTGTLTLSGTNTTFGSFVVNAVRWPWWLRARSESTAPTSW
jgi:autotransporter-associated beta strand protein